MYLKYLELAGFKSFAKKTKLEFKTPVTAIVGPNGSGKSNVAEAFRFALGEQRITQMRGKRTEDLIWNGSHKIPRSGKGQVTLTFDNRSSRATEGGRLFDIDFEEVAIERVIHRDASTEYLLNDSPVRLKDIVELLSGAHIGSSGHHIISQGETDRILLVNTKERKGMIEDALGLKVYQYKKLESERKLERTQQHKKEVESLRREIAPHLKFLKSQVEKVEKTREMRDELRDLYGTYLAAESSRLSSQEHDARQQREPLEHELGDVTHSLNEARRTLEQLEGKDEKSEELLRLEQELSNVRNSKEALTREVGQIEGEIRAHKRVTGEQGKAIPAQEVVALRNALEEQFASVVDSDDLSFIKQVVGAIRKRLGDFIHKFAEGEGDSERAYEEAKARHAEKEGELQSAVSEEERLVVSYNELKKSIEQERHSGREAERTVFSLSSKENELRVKLADIARTEEVRTRDVEELEEERREAGVLVGDIENNQDAHFESDEDRIQKRKRMERLKIRLEDTGTSTGEDIMREFEEVQERDVFLERELADLDSSSEKLNLLIRDLEDKLGTLFQEGVEAINGKFQELFALMFGGGNASLKLVYEADEEGLEDGGESQEGIEIAVNLPRKRIRGLHMLSGGERALTSIALLFAMSQVNPPPFLVLDETDAALDEANSRRYGDMIESLSKDSQLIVITHNRETMSRAGVLYGVTMGSDGVSQLLSVGFDEAVQVAK